MKEKDISLTQSDQGWETGRCLRPRVEGMIVGAGVQVREGFREEVTLLLWVWRHRPLQVAYIRVKKEKLESMQLTSD